MDAEEIEASSEIVEEVDRIEERPELSDFRGRWGRTFPGISARSCEGS